jgi:hypothetical protein
MTKMKTPRTATIAPSGGEYHSPTNDRTKNWRATMYRIMALTRLMTVVREFTEALARNWKATFHNMQSPIPAQKNSTVVSP